MTSSLVCLTGILFNPFKNYKQKNKKHGSLHSRPLWHIVTTEIFSPLTSHPPIGMCTLYEKNAYKTRFRVYTWTMVIKQIILLNNKNNQAQRAYTNNCDAAVYFGVSRDGCGSPNKYITFLNCNNRIHNECLSRHQVIIIHTSVDTTSPDTHIANY